MQLPACCTDATCFLIQTASTCTPLRLPQPPLPLFCSKWYYLIIDTWSAPLLCDKKICSLSAKCSRRAKPCPCPCPCPPVGLHMLLVERNFLGKCPETQWEGERGGKSEGFDRLAEEDAATGVLMGNWKSICWLISHNAKALVEKNKRRSSSRRRQSKRERKATFGMPIV